jgi:hypothetical protein
MTFANTLVSKICVQVGDTPKIRFLIQYLHFARCPQQNCGAAVTPDKLPDLQDLISGFTDQRSVVPCLMSPLAFHDASSLERPETTTTSGAAGAKAALVSGSVRSSVALTRFAGQVSSARQDGVPGRRSNSNVFQIPEHSALCSPW